MSKKDLFIVSGGIGKNICFSSCLNKLDKVNVMSAWPKLFTNHPNVNYSYDFTINPLHDDVEFLSKFKSVKFIEAYNSYFHLNKTHLVSSFRKILNIEDDECIYNEIYFTEQEEKVIQSVVTQLGDFVLVQFVGSDENNQETDFVGSRSLIKSEAQEIINILNFDLKLNVLNVYSKTNMFENTARLDMDLHYMNYAHLLKYAKGFIGIDSSLNHMSANKFCNTKGVVMWNDHNVVERFSYEKNINIISNTPNVMRFNPNQVVENLLKLLKK
jgi:hypothetical protein